MQHLYRVCRAGAQIILPKSGRGLCHVTLQLLALSSKLFEL